MAELTFDHLSENDYEADFWTAWSSIPKEVPRQFFPLKWIMGNDPREVVKTHMRISKEETTKARETIPNILDVSYGSHENEKLDIYGTDLHENSPTLFWVHGGYWRTGDRSWSAPFARHAHSWGVRSIVVDYPLAPAATLPEICTSTKNALSFALRKYPNSPFILAGHSAGVQIILSLFHQIPQVEPLPNHLIPQVKGVYCLSGPYDMRPIPHMPSIQKDLQLTSQQATSFSPILTTHRIHPTIPKAIHFFLGVTQHDPPAIQRLTRIHANLLRDLGFPVRFHLFPQEDHFTVVNALIQKDSEVTLSLRSFILSSSSTIDTNKLMSKL